MQLTIEQLEELTQSLMMLQENLVILQQKSYDDDRQEKLEMVKYQMDWLQELMDTRTPAEKALADYEKEHGI